MTFFFFFKQKTAYEMRISDWSSDVCSSDLEVWLKFENLQFTAAYKERGALNALLLLDEKAKARGVIAASAGNHAQGLAYHGKRLGVPVTIVMRSEEHTSELQSLMRISYAVFCLKTKKQQQPKNSRV